MATARTTPAPVAARDRYLAVERALDWPMVVLAIAFIPILVIPAVDTHLSPTIGTALNAAAWSIWAAFAVEYVALLVLATDRAQYLRTHVVELLLVAIPYLRPLRILSLLRIGASGATARRRTRRRMAEVATIWAILLTAGAIFMGAILELDAERGHVRATITSFSNALWWAAETVVHDGSPHGAPITFDGRLIGITLSVVGGAFVGVLTAAVATWLINDQVTATVPLGSHDLHHELAQLHTELRELRGALEGGAHHGGPSLAVVPDEEASSE